MKVSRYPSVLADADGDFVFPVIPGCPLVKAASEDTRTPVETTYYWVAWIAVKNGFDEPDTKMNAVYSHGQLPSEFFSRCEFHSFGTINGILVRIMRKKK